MISISDFFQCDPGYLRWGRKDPVLPPRVCAFAYPSCRERAAKGKGGMAEMPHKCGPMLMGVGWTEEFQSEVKMRSHYDKVEFLEQVKIEPSHEIGEGKSNKLLVGNYCLNLEDFKGDKEGRGRRENETETPKLARSKFFKGEVLEGKRKPKMMESFGYGTDPDAGKYMRLELESFRQVDFKYPAKLVWCGTSLSGGSLDEVEVSRRFQVRKLKAFTVAAVIYCF